jgi:hypothetical protein
VLRSANNCSSYQLRVGALEAAIEATEGVAAGAFGAWLQTSVFAEKTNSQHSKSSHDMIELRIGQSASPAAFGTTETNSPVQPFNCPGRPLSFEFASGGASIPPGFSPPNAARELNRSG